MKNRDRDSSEVQMLGLLEGLRNAAVAGRTQIADVTQGLERAFKPTDISRWMDNSSSGTGFGGRYHRVLHGHDFAANFSKVSQRFGTKRALSEYPFEIFKDATTREGVPYPGVQKLANAKIISPQVGGTWGSMSVAKAIPGALAIYGTYRLYQAGSENKLKMPSTLIFASIGIITKVSAGIVTQNPVLLLSGMGDCVILMTNRQQVKIALRRIIKNLEKFSNKVYSLSTLSTRKVLSILRAGKRVVIGAVAKFQRHIVSTYRRIKRYVLGAASRVYRWFGQRCSYAFS